MSQAGNTAGEPHRSVLSMHGDDRSTGRPELAQAKCARYTGSTTPKPKGIVAAKAASDSKPLILPVAFATYRIGAESFERLPPGFSFVIRVTTLALCLLTVSSIDAEEENAGICEFIIIHLQSMEVTNTLL